MCSDTPASTATLQPDLRSPAAARAFVRLRACPTHSGRVIDEAELLVSELVTNAVTHGCPPVTVDLTCCGELMQVCVGDRSPRRPELLHADADDEHGRGIALLDLVSEHWSVRDRPGLGKTVCFELRQQLQATA